MPDKVHLKYRVLASLTWIVYKLTGYDPLTGLWG